MSIEVAITSFNAVRQFVVVPDRYYRVELRSGILKFIKTGSQFDQNHSGSVGRHKMADNSSASVSDNQAEGIELPRTILILSGIGLTAVSLLLLFVAARAGWIVFPFAVLAAFGVVLLMAGFVTPTKRQRATRPHDFDIPISQIDSATLHVPRRETSVARLHIQPRAAKLIKLTINSRNDLEVVHSRLMPILGPRAIVA